MWLQFFEWFFKASLFINALLFVPQILVLLKTKHTNNLSLSMFTGLNLIQITIILHAYLVQDYELMIGFTLALLSCGTVTALILKYRAHEKRQHSQLSPNS